MTTMTGLNDRLQELLDIAQDLLDDPDSSHDEPADAFRYAILKQIEYVGGLPVLVKYGDADAVIEEMGIIDDEVWDATPEGDYTLFRVEQDDPLSVDQRSVLDRTMLSAGAWFIGSTGVRGQPMWEHQHYAWPNDHPVLELLDAE